MTFKDLPKGAKFFFKSSLNTVYRKVGKTKYVYDSDTKNRWKFWTPKITRVVNYDNS